MSRVKIKNMDFFLEGTKWRNNPIVLDL